MAALERPGRAVIAATKSGTEKNATVFARYWVEALEDPAAEPVHCQIEATADGRFKLVDLETKVDIATR